MNDNIRVDLSPGKGRGLFTNRQFKSSELIDVTYTWLLTPEDIELYDKTSISGHWFDHPKQNGYGLVPLGTAALVNHSKQPNAELIWIETFCGYVGMLFALHNIAKDSEILIDYGIDIEYNISVV